MSGLKRLLVKEYKEGVNKEHMECLELTGKMHMAFLGRQQSVKLGKSYRYFDCEEFQQLNDIYKNNYELPTEVNTFNTINFKYDPKKDKVIASYNNFSNTKFEPN